MTTHTSVLKPRSYDSTEIFRYNDTQVRDVWHTSRGLSFRWYWSEAEEQTFFRDMYIALHLDGLNVMPQPLLQLWRPNRSNCNRWWDAEFMGLCSLESSANNAILDPWGSRGHGEPVWEGRIYCNALISVIQVTVKPLTKQARNAILLNLLRSMWSPGWTRRSKALDMSRWIASTSFPPPK